MMRRLIMLFSCFLITACFTVGKRADDSAVAIYDFGPLSGARPAPLSGSPMALEVHMPPWFDGQGINYRLAYAEAARLRVYARARWAGPPAQLIEQSLGRDLAVLPAGQGRALCLLRVDIDEFSQVFASPARSRGVLQGRVHWLDRNRVRLAERPVNIEMPSASADSPGGVAAMTAAVAELAAQIRAVEGELLAAGRLNSCRP